MAAVHARLRLGALPLALALGLLGVGALGQRVVSTDLERTRQENFQVDAAAVTASFEDSAHRLTERAHLLPQLVERARSAATPNEALAGTVLTTLATVSPVPGAALVGEATRVAGEDIDLNDLLRASRTSLELARDTGTPHAGPAVDGFVLVSAPTYSGAGAPPTSTSDRRARLTGWTVGTVDPTALLGNTITSHVSGAVAVGPAAVALDEDAASSTKTSSTVLIGGQPWMLTVTARGAATPVTASWGVLALGVLGALGVLLAALRHRRTVLGLTAGRTTLEREAQTLAQLGPLLQQSLDLSDVLPSVAVRLADEFRLTRFTIQLLGERGELVEAFSFGPDQIGDSVEVNAAEPAAVPAHVGVTVPLVRAGRAIGVLQVASRETLGRSQLNTLLAAADLIAVATYNAELYDREQQAVRRLQDLDQLKDAFLGTISHELRTPITAISGFAALLHERWDEFPEKDRREFIGRVQRNAASLGMLVDQLLDFARLERQALTVSAVPLDVDVLVGGIVAQLLPLLGEHEIVTDLEPGATAETDAAAVERVLANLLTNAAKYSPAGSRIDVAVRRAGAQVVIEVTDQGPGIKAEDRQRVFRRFFRSDNSVTRATRGAGIGLAVVRELVVQLGGTVEAYENRPTGTRMVVRLPAARFAQTDEVIEIPAQPAADFAGTFQRSST